MILRYLLAIFVMVGLTFIVACIVWLPKINKDDLWCGDFTYKERIHETWKTIGYTTLLSLLYSGEAVILIAFFK